MLLEDEISTCSRLTAAALNNMQQWARLMVMVGMKAAAAVAVLVNDGRSYSTFVGRSGGSTGIRKWHHVISGVYCQDKKPKSNTT